MKNSASGDRSLVFTLFTLIEFACGMKRIVMMAASGTNKAVGPSLLEQKFNVPIFGRKSTLEIEEFKLFRHKTSLCDILLYT